MNEEVTQEIVEEVKEEEKPKIWYLVVKIGSLEGQVEQTSENADYKLAIADALGIKPTSIYIDSVFTAEARWYGQDQLIGFHLAGSKTTIAAYISPRRY